MYDYARCIFMHGRCSNVRAAARSLALPLVGEASSAPIIVKGGLSPHVLLSGLTVLRIAVALPQRLYASEPVGYR